MTLGHVLTLAVVIGVAVGVTTPVRPVDLLALALALGSIAMVVPDRRRVRVRALVICALAAVAAAHGAAARDRALAPPLAAWFHAIAGADARLAPPVRMRGILLDDAAPGDAGVRLTIAVTAVDDGRGWASMRGRVQVHVNGDLAAARAAEWTAGRHVEAPVLLRWPTVYRNPGGPSDTWQELRRPFDLAGTMKSAAVVAVERGHWWDETAAAVRRQVRDAARRYLAPIDPQAAAIVTAILIGDRAGLSDDLERRLQAAGTYHVIAISGGNVAMLTAACFFLIRSVVRSRRAGSLLTLIIVLAYGSIVGGDPSVARAVTAAAIYLAIDLAGLVPGAINVLGLVAVCLAVFDPLMVIDAGAWLSFGATFAIIVGVPRLAARVAVQSRVLRALVVLMAATLAAEIALLPIQAALFHRLTIAGLVLNLVAIPAMALVQAAGLVMTLFASWWPGGASASAHIGAWGVWALAGSADLVTLVPMLSWRVPPAHWSWSVAYYAAWATILWGRDIRRSEDRRLHLANGAPGLQTGRGSRRIASIAAAVCAFVIATAPFMTKARPAAPWLRVTLIDVGQGDAILVQFPSGHSMLVDTGGTPGAFDIGGRVVTPAAWALGVRRLDWLVITHGDNDHAGGAMTVVDDLRPREIWEGVPVPRAVPLQAIRRRAIADGASWRRVMEGEVLHAGDVEIAVVHPPRPDWERPKVRNDDSVVLLLRYGDVEWLLTGDAAGEFERGFSDGGAASGAPDDRRRLRLLKVGHHGSRSSTSAPFVAAYPPDLAFVSVGASNLFGHPAPDILGRLRDAGSDCFRTDLHGAITVETDGRRVRVRTMSGVAWEVALPRPLP